MRWPVFTMLLALGGPAAGQGLDAVPEPPELPAAAAIRDGEPMAPPADEAQERETAVEVARTQEGVKEYSIKGRRIMLEITPQVGPSYYVADPTGDGTMQERSPEDLDGERNLTKWRIGSW